MIHPRAGTAAVLLLAAAGAAAAATPAPHRRVAVIIDTSGSMLESDRPRYTAQIAQVVADLLAEDDVLAVITLGGGGCSARASSALALRLNPADRAGFKRELDRRVSYSGGNAFAAPIRTAIEALSHDATLDRMLLIIADSGGLGGCDAALNPELLALRRSGARVAAINLGTSAGAFDSNPAFEFTTAALDAQQLVEAVAQVVQRFLGARQVQTGGVTGDVTVTVAPFVRQAFLVVAADGTLGPLALADGHPSAKQVDLHYRGGGATEGLDRRRREYRIVRLAEPQAGAWTFRLPARSERAGFMFLQDSSVGVSFVSQPKTVRGQDTPLELELVDQVTGRRITDTRLLPGLTVTLDMDGRAVEFRDDGRGGDRQAGDGLFTAVAAFDREGARTLSVRVQSDVLDRTTAVPFEVVTATWKIEVQSPPRATIDTDTELRVRLTPLGAAALLVAPEAVAVEGAGASVVLARDAALGSSQEPVYRATFAPLAMGVFSLRYVPVGGTPAGAASAPLEVRGGVEFGAPIPARLGPGGSHATLLGALDLGGATVKGRHSVRVSSSFELERSVLEIDPGGGFVPLGRRPLDLELSRTGPRTWPLRLRIGSCPEACRPETPFEIRLEASDVEGQPQTLVVPLAVEVRADTWLRCWWPVILGLLALGGAAAVGYGVVSPSRFAPRVGVMLADEEDVNAEGYFHPIRAVRGSSSGFFRDARVFLLADYRLSARPRGALARLRADGQHVRIAPVQGASLWRRTGDGAWEALPAEETTARFGVLYRNEGRTLFFEFRNG